jgi:hypothetical protein
MAQVININIEKYVPQIIDKYNDRLSVFNSIALGFYQINREFCSNESIRGVIECGMASMTKEQLDKYYDLRGFDGSSEFQYVCCLFEKGSNVMIKEAQKDGYTGPT